MINERTYERTLNLIRERNFELALAVIVNDLVVSGKMDSSLFTIVYDNRSDQGDGSMGLRYKPEPGTGKFLPDNPLPITIFAPAFASVQWLISTILHEYQHVLQEQRTFTREEITKKNDKNYPGGRLEERIIVDEVRSYLWEIENAHVTGIINQPGSMRNIFDRLTSHYNILTPGQKEVFEARYKAAARMIVPKSKEEEELEKCDNEERKSAHCKRLYERVRRRYGNKERDVNFNPDKDVNKKRIRRDDAPVEDSFRLIYNRLDSWDIYIRRLHNGLYEEFKGEYKLNEKRNKWLTKLKEDVDSYKRDFRNVDNFGVDQTQRDFKENTLRKIEIEINGLNREIASWYKKKTGDKAGIDTIIEKVHKTGTELWRGEWLDLILRVNRILSSLWPAARERIINWLNEKRKTHPGADLSGKVANIDYVGSLATGYKGAPKQFARFNVYKFDVDANIEAPPLAKYAMNIDHIKPDRKRIFALGQGTSITPLLDFCFDAHQSLSTLKEFDGKDPFDVVINAPELPDQKRGREGTERIYKLREKIGEGRYNDMIRELINAGLLLQAEVGFRLKEELSKEEAATLNTILKKYESTK